MINKAVAINPRMLTSIILIIIIRWKGLKINIKLIVKLNK
jgi:hypothetical protein